MKILLLSILLLLALKTTAQVKVDKLDEFTGKKIRSATVTLGKAVADKSPTLSFMETDSTRWIAFSWPGFNTQVNRDEEIQATRASILIKMESDSVFRFRANPSTSRTVHNGSTYTVIVSSEIDYKTLMYFMENKVKVLRFAQRADDNGTNIDALTDKNRKEIQKAAMFLLGMKRVTDQNE